MGRPRKPTALLSPDAFRRNPKRARDGEPQPTGPLGDPPEMFTDKEKAMWRDLAANLPPGVARNSDRLAFGTMVKIAAQYYADGVGGKKGVSVGELAQMNNLAAKFGMTPADRSKIALPKPSEEDNPFAELAAEASRRPPAQLN
jgi:hypothetical protein